MIDINLIPPASRKRTSGPLSRSNIDLPPEILFGVGGGCLALLIIAHVFLLGAWGIKAIVLAAHKAAWQDVLPDKKNIDALAGELRDLKKRMASITDVTSSKSMGWSHKLNLISDALPKGLWLK